MIASRTESRLAAAAIRSFGLLAIACALIACASKPAQLSRDELLLPMSLPTRWLPDRADTLAADLAVAAFNDDRSALERNLSDIVAIGSDRKGEDLDALCTDLANATLDDVHTYRESSKRLTAGWGTDPAIEARLDMVVEDDPRRLAWRRRFDTWEHLWARTFNAVSEPLGQSLITGFIIAPFTIASSGAHYLASFSNDEPLSTTDRQALALRKEFVAHNPEHEEADKVRQKIASADAKLAETMQKRRLRDARAALAAGSNRLAVLSAERVLFWGESEDAREIIATATEAIALQRALEDQSLEAPAAPPRDLADPDAYALAIELMNTSSRSLPLSEATITKLAHESDPARAGEASFILAIAQYEAGLEDASFARLAHLARKDSGTDPIARHAAWLLGDPWENPYGAYRAMRVQKRWEHVGWRLLGDWSRRNRYPNLWAPIGYLIDLPSMFQMLGTSPVRFHPCGISRCRAK